MSAAVFLCTLLMIVCNLQLISTGLVAITMPEVLWLTKSHLSTGAGLIAGLIALPTVIRLRSSQMSPDLDRIYGYTITFQRMAIIVAGFSHFAAIVATLIALFRTTDLCKDFKKLMRSYHTKHSFKVLVDNIQYILQCCGAANHKDWFKIDWEGGCGPIERLYGKTIETSMKKMLVEDTDQYPDLAMIRNDAVPYSCCARTALGPCIHRDIFRLGTATINEQGCGQRLLTATLSLLWFELLLYNVSLVLEVAIFLLLKRHSSYQQLSEEPD